MSLGSLQLVRPEQDQVRQLEGTRKRLAACYLRRGLTALEGSEFDIARKSKSVLWSVRRGIRSLIGRASCDEDSSIGRRRIGCYRCEGIRLIPPVWMLRVAADESGRHDWSLR